MYAVAEIYQITGKDIGYSALVQNWAYMAWVKSDKQPTWFFWCVFKKKKVFIEKWLKIRPSLVLSPAHWSDRMKEMSLFSNTHSHSYRQQL